MTYFQSLFMTRFAAGLSEATESRSACGIRSTDVRLNEVHEKRFCEKPALCLRRLRIVACFVLACGVMRATDLTTDLTLVARPGPRQLLSLSSDFVLDWDPPTGTHNIWKYNPALSGQTDPLPGNPVVTGAWSSIRTGHELVYLGKGVVLDWQPLTGAYRLWQYDSSLTGAVDPFSSAAITSGTWSSIRTGHKLVYLGPVGGGSTADRVLDWEPGTGHYRLWIYDRSVTGNGDPFPGSPVTQGTWASVHVGHELISLEGGRVLDWEPQSGHYRVWGFNPNAKVDQDPLPAPPHNEGTWGTVHLGHELLLLQGRQRVLDWEPITGRNRVWSYDSTASGAADPLPSAITSWTWQGIRSSTPAISTASEIKHLVLIVQENHSFDAYFGNYCTAAPGSNPICETGSGCCEGGPKNYAGINQAHRLDDTWNGQWGPQHYRNCEEWEIDIGSPHPMDRFATPNPSIAGCGSSNNFSYAWGQDVALYWSYAQSYALADRYFQPVVGGSAANDVYFAGAVWRFDDNAKTDDKFRAVCCFDKPDPNDIQHIGALLWKNGAAFTVYSDGYINGLYQSGDNPFAYFLDPHARDPRDPGLDLHA